LRAVMLVKSGAAQGDSSLIDVTAEIRQRLSSQASKVTIPDLLRWIKLFSEADANLRTTSYRQLPLELALVEALTPAGPEQLVPLAAAQAEPRASQAPSHMPAPSPIRASNGSARPELVRPEPVTASMPPPLLEDLNTLMEIAPAAEPALAEEQAAEQSAELALASEPDSSPEAVQPEPEEPTAGTQDELSRLQKLWPALIEQLNARSKNVAGAFRDPTQVRPHNVDGKMVTISFRYPIQAKRSRSEPARGIIEQALTRTMGYPCVLEAILFDEESGNGGANGADGNPAEPKGSKPKAPAPHETPRGRAAMNIFGIEKFEDQ